MKQLTCFIHHSGLAGILLAVQLPGKTVGLRSPWFCAAHPSSWENSLILSNLSYPSFGMILPFFVFRAYFEQVQNRLAKFKIIIAGKNAVK